MINEWIKKWFSKRTRIEVESLDVSSNYFELDYIDSFSFMELLSDIESELNLTLSEDDFDENRVFTIKGLINVLEAKCENNDI